MAEFVQKNIEEMLPELDCLRKIGLFSLEETREVLKKRKRYEYKMQRRTKEKEVYLQYVQYEKCVLDLIKKRREKRSIDEFEEEIEKPIILRIYKLFRIACFRFKSDIKLWLTYIDFVKGQGDKQRVSKVFTSLLQIHGKKPNLWISAAKFEFEVNDSPEIARQLFQRAIRFLPESKKLWCEYFRMELLCVELILKRKQALGIQDANTHQNTNEKRIEDAILNCKIAEIIVKNAIKTILDPYILQTFVQIAKDFDFTLNLIQFIYDLLRNNANSMNKEEVWDIIAKRSLMDEVEIIRKCTETGQVADFSIADLEHEANRVYLEAIDKLHTPKMWNIYLDFCFERYEMESKYLREERFARLNDALKQAKSSIELSLSQCIRWLNALNTQTQMTQFLDILEWSLNKYSSSADLWTFKLKWTIDSEESHDKIREIFQKALKCVSDRESSDLWSLMIKWAKQSTSDALIEELFKSGCLLCKEISIPLRVQYLDWAFTNGGKKKVRSVYESLCKIPPFSVEFYLKFIELESFHSKINVKLINDTYDEALGHFGTQNDDLWLSYVKHVHESNRNDPQAVYQIYWKALKTLDESLIEDFTNKFNMFKINLNHENVEIN